MSKYGPNNRRETFKMVFKRYFALITVLAVILAVVSAAPFVIERLNRRKAAIHTAIEAIDLGVKPIDILSGDEDDPRGEVLIETTRVSDDYFADTVFIGDSLTTGLEIYEIFDDFIAVAVKGVNPESAMTDAFHKIGDQKYTMVEAVEYYDPSTVYVMLGSNGINWETTDWLVEKYEILIDELMTRVPGCNVVIQSITPVGAKLAERDPVHYSLENIHKYNDDLKDLALRKGIYFLDVYSAIANEDGFMPEDIVAADGVHMSVAGYEVWKECLLTHTIKGDSAYSITPDGLIGAAREQA